MSKKNNISDLLGNISFLKWLRKEKGADNTHWEQWQQENASNAQLAKEAELIDKGIPFKKNKNSSGQASWNSFERKLAKENAVRNIQPRKNWLKIAASIAVLLIVGLGLKNYFSEPSLNYHKTEFSETATILLPDGSEVLLGANSTIAYYDNFEATKHRTVQLDGEAFFKVVPQLNGHQFTVSLKDLEIQVLGTAFNVNSHRKESIISLIEGEIDLSKGEKKQLLKVGQTAYFNQDKSKFEFLKNQTNYWSAWTSQKWAFENTSIKEIAQRIEETLGLTCVFSDTFILEKTVSGNISIENKEVLFEALEFLLTASIKEEGQQLFIELLEDN